MSIREKEWVKRSGKGFFIESSRIRMGPWGNVRTHIDNNSIKMRAESLIAFGQKRPVIGLLSEDGEWFELIDGEIRLMAWKYAKENLNANLDEKYGGMYCELQDISKINISKTEIIKLQLSYGTDSEPLSQYDKAISVFKLYEGGEKIADLAIMLHCSVQHIRNLISLSLVSKEIMCAVKPTTALKIAKTSQVRQKEVVDRIRSGEKIKCKDIPPKAEESIKIIQESIILNPHKLSFDEICLQIILAEKKMRVSKTAREMFGWQQYTRALKSTIGKDPPL